MTVKPGYKIGRDEHGLTENERLVLIGLTEGKPLAHIGAGMGLSKQRAAKLAADLVQKQWLTKGGVRGQYLIDSKKLPVINEWKEKGHGDSTQN